MTQSVTVTNGGEGDKGQGRMRVTIIRLHGHLGSLCACLCGAAGPLRLQWVEEWLRERNRGKERSDGASGRTNKYVFVQFDFTSSASRSGWVGSPSQRARDWEPGGFSSTGSLVYAQYWFEFLEIYFPNHSTLYLAIHIYSWKKKGRSQIALHVRYPSDKSLPLLNSLHSSFTTL